MPRISNASLTNRRFRVESQSTALAARRVPRGTTFRYTLQTAATLRIAITRQAPGLRNGRRCVASTNKLKKKHARPCTRTLSVGTLTRANRPAGPGTVSFSGRIGKRALTPHAYRATLTATNAAGGSTPVVLKFTVVR